MLCLSRKVSQRITISDYHEITITVTRIDGDRVTLGIEAPPLVKVMREELTEKESCPPSSN